MKVVITAEAEADFEAIGDYIAEENPRRAASFIAELRDCCNELAEMPLRFSVVPSLPFTSIRRRVYGNYLIFYRVQAEIVEVLHILHGASDYGPILGTDMQ